MAVILCALGIYYYVALPAISIHSMDFWIFLIVAVLLFAVGLGVSFARKEHLTYYELKKLKVPGLSKGYWRCWWFL